MVAVAAMIDKKDHASTDPSQQPLISDSTETNHNLLAPPIPTNPLHLAAAAVLMLPPFPNMETAEKIGCMVALGAAATMDDEDNDDSDDDNRLIVF